MKKLLSLLVCLLTVLSAMAQITAPAVESRPDDDQHYMLGAVPMVDGKVILTRTLDVAPALSEADALARAEAWLERISHDSRMQYDQALPSEPGQPLLHTYTQELTLSQSFISHDFAQVSYVLHVSIEGHQATLQMSRISYRYREGDEQMHYSAEETISDEHGMNRKKTRIILGYRKFRIKTIDLIDELATSLQRELAPAI